MRARAFAGVKKPQRREVKGVKVMNFYGPVPSVSALSLSLRAALPLKDNHAGQFVLQGRQNGPAQKLNTRGVHIHWLSLTPLRPVVLNDLWPVHYPFQGGRNAFGLILKVKPEWQLSMPTIVFREVSQML